MKLKTAGTLALLIFFALARAARAKDAPYLGSPELQKIKRLEGRWVGPDPWKKRENMIVEYKVISAGHAVVETIFPGTSREAVSVYSDKDGKLTVTHFGLMNKECPLEYRFEKDNELIFMLAVGSGIKPLEPHMHELAIKMVDDDHVIQRWTPYDEGVAKAPMVLPLARMRDSEPADGRKNADSERAKREAQAEEARRVAQAEKARQEEEAKEAERVAQAEKLRKQEELRKAKSAVQAEDSKRLAEADKARQTAETQKAKNTVQKVKPKETQESRQSGPPKIDRVERVDKEEEAFGSGSDEPRKKTVKETESETEKDGKEASEKDSVGKRFKKLFGAIVGN